MKKLSKLMISLALVLMFALPVLLTGCGTASAKEIANITNSVAEKYDENYTSFENGKNITYKIITKGNYSEKQIVSYKKKATDEEFTEGEFTRKNTNNYSTTFSFKRMDEEDLALYIKYVGDYKQIYYTTDENYLLKKVEYVRNATTEIKISFKKDKYGEKTYYIVKNSKIVEDETNSDKFEYQDIGREDYVNCISDYMQKLNSCTIKSFFFGNNLPTSMEMMEPIVDYSAKDGKISSQLKIYVPVVKFDEYDEGELITYYNEALITSSYTANKFDKAKAIAKYFDEESSSNDSIELITVYSSNGIFSIGNLEEADYNDSLINDYVYMPESILDLFDGR